MDANPTAVPGRPEAPDLRLDSPPAPPPRARRAIRDRLIGGLTLALPLLLTFWIIAWLYSILEHYVIGPIAGALIWKIEWATFTPELPFWFNTYLAPVLAVLLALALLYCLDLFADTGLRRGIDWTMKRVPMISYIYNPLQKMFQNLEKPRGQQRMQRMVLITFPHPGVKLPAFVTATCRDIQTNKVLLCVYVPTTPVPTSGYMLLVPEEEVTELNWSTEQALQAVISGGLVCPNEVSYFKNGYSHPAMPGTPLLPDPAPQQPRDG